MQPLANRRRWIQGTATALGAAAVAPRLWAQGAPVRIGYAIAPAGVAENQRKVAVPFGVTDLAQTAALASLDAEDELARRIDEVITQRDRLHAVLTAAGWPAVPSQANFVWVPSGDRTDELESMLQAGGVIARSFAGEGIRISSGSEEDIDRVEAALAASVRDGATAERVEGGA